MELEHKLLTRSSTSSELDATIERIRREGCDDELVEVKSCAKDLGKSVWDSVSAFANTRGGSLILGLAEDSDFTPVLHFDIDRTIDQFVSGIGHGGEPGRLTNPPTYELARCQVDGQPVLWVTINENPPEIKPCYVTTKGLAVGAYKRIADKDLRLSPTEIYELQHLLDPSQADRDVIPGATTNDLSNEAVERLLERKANSKALRLTNSRDEKMRRLNLLSPTGEVTMAGLLTVGIYPQQFLPRLFIDVTAHPTNDKSASSVSERFLDRVRCEGALIEMIDEAIDVIARNLRTVSVVTGNARRDQLEVPREVLREALANAVVHRQYHALFRGEPVSVDIYPDRIAISSPGGLWGGKTIENLDDGTSRCRNQTLMQILSDTPSRDNTFSVEGQGGGVLLMINEMRAHSLAQPQFQASPDRVIVELARHGAEISEEREWLSVTAQRLLSKHESAALLTARRNGQVSVSDLRQDLQIDSDDVRDILSRLTKEGLMTLKQPNLYTLIPEEDHLTQSQREVWESLSLEDPDRRGMGRCNCSTTKQKSTLSACSEPLKYLTHIANAG